MTRVTSRHWLSFVLFGAAAVLLGVATASRAETPGRLNIGFQKSSLNLIVLKFRSTLDRRLESLGVSVTWTEFPAGPQLLEALSVGSVDFGMTGDTPPIFAQAASTSLVYVGNEPPKPEASSIIVKKDSPVRSLADLRGRKIAFTKGSSAHYLVVRALAVAADSLGYEGVLIPTGRSCEDPWVVASSLIDATRQLRFLVAVRRG